MRNTLLAMTLATGLGLGGCATGPGGTPTFDPTQLANVEAQVQQTAATVCGFVPTLGTVASIIGALAGAGPIVGLVNQAAQSICNAVVPAKASLRQHSRKFGPANAPVALGVPVYGYFIR